MSVCLREEEIKPGGAKKRKTCGLQLVAARQEGGGRAVHGRDSSSSSFPPYDLGMSDTHICTNYDF